MKKDQGKEEDGEIITVIWAVFRSQTDRVPLLFPTTKWSPRTSNSVTYHEKEYSCQMFIEEAQQQRWVLFYLKLLQLTLILFTFWLFHRLKLQLTSFFSKFSQELVNSDLAPHWAISVTQETLMICISHNKTPSILHLIELYYLHNICDTRNIVFHTTRHHLHLDDSVCNTI